MVTGIEIAGLVLASLPFVAKSLTDYANGIETLRLFRTGRYSRQYREWASGIETQRVILLNNITELLDDLVEDEEEISEMKRDGQHARWTHPDTDKELQRRLGADYEPFMNNMRELCDLLSQMERRLGPHTRDNSMVRCPILLSSSRVSQCGTIPRTESQSSSSRLLYISAMCIIFKTRGSTLDDEVTFLYLFVDISDVA
jgi:hypothetical protein